MQILKRSWVCYKGIRKTVTLRKYSHESYFMWESVGIVHANSSPWAVGYSVFTVNSHWGEAYNSSTEPVFVYV
jgi:hypothetical protein